MKIAVALLVLALQPPPAFRFDAVSIRPNDSGTSNISVGPVPGGFRGTNTPLFFLITTAYEVQPYQIAGLPDWVRQDRYDVVARINDSAPDASSRAAVASALRALLADRLKLVAHWETQERPVYALVRLRPNGVLGPALKRSAIDCEAMRAAVLAAAQEGRPAPPLPPANTPDRVACGLRNTGGRIIFGGNRLSTFTGALSGLLGNEIARMVIDRTGLDGTWDFEFAYAPERLSTTNTSDAGLPSIFTAIEEQLGLRLESTTAPVQILVIDHVERPSPD
jgi:uncharacterized protein (TIGR03435 family)